MFAGISIVYYLDMIYLTIDKFLQILLNIKYHLYWNETKAKWLLAVTWLFAGLLVIILALLHHYDNHGWEEIIFMYCFLDTTKDTQQTYDLI